MGRGSPFGLAACSLGAIKSGGYDLVRCGLVRPGRHTGQTHTVSSPYCVTMCARLLCRNGQDMIVALHTNREAEGGQKKHVLLANSEQSRGRECVHESGARDQQLDMNYASLRHVRRDVTLIHYASMQACESVPRRRSVPRRFLSRVLRSRDTRAGTTLASRYRPLSKLSSHLRCM